MQNLVMGSDVHRPWGAILVQHGVYCIPGRVEKDPVL